MGKERQETVWIFGTDVQWFRIKHSGLYDMDKLLTAAKGYLSSKRYITVDAEHTEAVKGGGKEIRIEWKPFRNVNDYLKFNLNFEVTVWRELDVLVDENGKKVKMQQGDLEVRFKASMAKNYRKTFRGPGKEFLRQTYEKYLIRRDLEQYEKVLQQEAEEFVDTIKMVLGSFRR